MAQVIAGQKKQLFIQPPGVPPESKVRFRSILLRSVWHWFQAEVICSAQFRLQ
jgi:hypothetical protein